MSLVITSLGKRQKLSTSLGKRQRMNVTTVATVTLKWAVFFLFSCLLVMASSTAVSLVYEGRTAPYILTTRVTGSGPMFTSNENSRLSNSPTSGDVGRLRLMMLEDAEDSNTTLVVHREPSFYMLMTTTIENPREPAVIHLNASKGLLWGEVMELWVDITVYPVSPLKYPEWKRQLDDYMETSGEGWDSVFQVNLRTTSYEIITDEDDGNPYYEVWGRFSGGGGVLGCLMMVSNATMIPEGHKLDLDLQYRPSDKFASYFPDTNDVYIELDIQLLEVPKVGRHVTLNASDLPVIVNPNASSWNHLANLIGGRVLMWLTYWPNQTVTLNVTQVHEMWSLELERGVNITHATTVPPPITDDDDDSVVAHIVSANERIVHGGEDMLLVTASNDNSTSSPATSRSSSFIVTPGTQVHASYLNPGNMSTYLRLDGTIAYEAGPPKFMISAASSSAQNNNSTGDDNNNSRLVQFVIFLLPYDPLNLSDADVLPIHNWRIGDSSAYLVSVTALVFGAVMVMVLKREMPSRRWLSSRKKMHE